MTEKVMSDLDKELEEANKANKGFIDDDETKKVEDPKEPIEPKDPVEPIEPKDPVEPKEPADPKEPVEPADPKEPIAPKEPVVERKPRFIPIPKYQEEKKSWKTSLEEKETRIAELEAEAKKVSKPEEGTKASEDKIKAFADKHNMNEEAARDLVDIARDGTGIPKETLEKINNFNAKQESQIEQQQFDSEWTGQVDALKKEFPNATAADLKEAKKMMDDLAHSEQYSKTTLDYILFKNKKDFSDVLNGSKPRAGIDPGKVGLGDNHKLSGKDFKPVDGKYDFSSMANVKDEATRTAIMKDMDPIAFMEYMKHLEFSEDDGVEVNRGGRIVKLK